MLTRHLTRHMPPLAPHTTLFSKLNNAVPNSKFWVEIHINIIETTNLGLETTVSDQDREQGCFKRSSEGAVESSERAWESSKGAVREQMDETV